MLILGTLGLLAGFLAAYMAGYDAGRQQGHRDARRARLAMGGVLPPDLTETHDSAKR